MENIMYIRYISGISQLIEIQNRKLGTIKNNLDFGWKEFCLETLCDTGFSQEPCDRTKWYKNCDGWEDELEI
jgi:hypothetical protein